MKTFKDISAPVVFFAAACFLIILAFAVTVRAVSYPVGDGVSLVFEAPESPWMVATEPPAFLVDERAEHLHEPQLKAARKAGITDPGEVARQMLGINEIFLSNAETGSHIEVDFSPLKPGDEPPSAEVLRSSAEFAGEGLSNEEGIRDVHSRVRPFAVSGSEHSFRLDADYEMHHEKLLFVGVIGYAARHWFFLYYTGPRGAAGDVESLEAWLSSCRVVAL